MDRPRVGVSAAPFHLPPGRVPGHRIAKGNGKPDMNRDLIPKVSQWPPKLAQSQGWCLSPSLQAAGPFRWGLVSHIPGSQVL